MLLRQIINPAYVVGRLRLIAWEAAHPGSPWLAAEAVEILDSYLAPHHVALEYGSGRSTTWIAKRVARLVSVEADPTWHSIVSASLSKERLTNVDLRLEKLEHSADNLCHRSYETTPSYVAVADTFADASIDFCLVDGQYREACIATAAPKLKPGGLLVLDNMNWRPLSHWAIPPSLRLISAGRNVKTQTGVFVQTSY